MIRKTSHAAAVAIAGVLVILVFVCAVLIYRERQTLAILLHPSQAPRATEVFARWIELKPGYRLTAKTVEAELRALEYEATPGDPMRPGQFRVMPSHIAVYTRGFRFPDRDFPAQLLHLRFSGDQLIEARLGTGSEAPTWRLEPKRLAQWSVSGKTAKTQVRLSELPPWTWQSVVAIEDKRFFRHGAFDAIGIGRALSVDLRHGRLRQGASTLSQQLARSIFLDVNRTWRRKLLEAGLAFYLEARYSKTKLLEMYLNQVYWGQDGAESVIGIEAACQSYFGTPARHLTIGQAALLAGILQSPNRFSPRVNPKVALARRDRVLGLMEEQKWITPDQRTKATAEKLHLATSQRRSNDAAYFLSTIRDELEDRYSLPVLLSQGWRIYTTLDPVLEADAVAAMKQVPGPTKQDEFGEGPQGALVAIDPRSGAVRAWVGGTNFRTSPYDRAINAFRQPGSAVKPFVLLAALENRKATTATLLEDKPVTFKNDGLLWTPKNYDRIFREGASAWDSLIYSLNIPMVHLAELAGFSAVADTLHRAGIVSPMKEVPSLALGTSEVTVLEMTGAYATLAAEGRRTPPYTIEAIVQPDGTVAEWHQTVTEQVFSPQSVFIVTQALMEVVNQGTGRAARALGFTPVIAGKTGTSENYQDAWFVGYSPDLVAGVWVGYDRPKSLGRSAAGIALPVWVSFMSRVYARVPPEPFKVPEGLVRKDIDVENGLGVRSGCKNRRAALFLPGTEPTEQCPVHAGGIVGFFKRLTGSAK